jgi:outer membrane protein assembly factor BamB
LTEPNKTLGFVFITFVLMNTIAAADNWPRFRGPAGAGISEQQGLPVKWSDDDYAWKAKLPGLGHSSPSVWNDHVFVTAAEDEGRTRRLFDVNANNGEIRWTKSLTSKTHEKHPLNSFASATPATEGKRVYALFASDAQMLVLAYDFSGQEIWRRDLGPFKQKDGQVHGCGTSPIVFEDLVILANQQDGPASIIALDSATGKTRWKNDRQLRTTAHSTPLVLQTKSAAPRLFVSNTGDGISSLNPRTGEILFRADLLSARCVSSPVVAGDFVLAISGGGGRGRDLTAIPLDSRGDLVASDAAWKRDRNLPYVPTPIAVGEQLFLWGDNGVVSCLQAKTGEEVWTERVGGNYSGSPVCVDGNLYCIAQDGTVAVIEAGREYKLLGKTELGEGSHTTPAISGGRMFLRGFEHLFCLKAANP